MISVGSRDGRKGLGLGLGLGFGFGVVRRDMEETEFEEGEACVYQNHDDDDDDSTIDPDVALSYIDDKLQDVLGHFQKDFEGGVSAENLGAKFGGYGSFLPTYQRSPVSSHPRTPMKFHNHNTPRSPNNFHLEGGCHNSVIPSSASQLVRLGTGSASAASLPSLKAQPVNDSVKQDACISSVRAEESNSKYELLDVSTNHSDPKTLKVRIKVGADNLLTRKNADLYSGLGLDFSPSSSMDDSTIGSDGFSHEPQNAPYVSPTSILEIMTSFAVHGGLLLSPLPDDLIFLTEKEKLRGESRSGSRHRGKQESSICIVNGSDSLRVDGNVLGDKKMNSSEKNAFSMEVKNGHGKNVRSGMKKEMDIDTLACEELVSNAPKLPLLSKCNVDSENVTAKEVDTVKPAHKVVVKNEFVSDFLKEEPLEAFSAQDNCRSEKLNINVWEDKKANSHGDVSVKPRKEDSLKGEKTDVISKVDSNVSKGKKVLKLELIDPLKKNGGLKATSHEGDRIRQAPGKEHSSSGGKKKSKGSRSHVTQGAEVPRDGLRLDSSLVSKDMKSGHANFSSKSEVEDIKMKKNSGKARDTYKDFFGDIELEQGDDDADSVEMPSVDRLKYSEVVEKSSLVSDSALEERSKGRRIGNLSVSDTHPKEASNTASLIGTAPQSDVVPGTAAPVVQEDWVCCDKCQKWRLLPLGTNPDSLPEKWLCSMLYWLPGMNRCNISEEETTKALRAQYHIPAPGNQHGLPGGDLSGITSTDVRHFNQNQLNHGSHAVTSGGKKNYGLKEASIANNEDGPSQLPNSTKNLQSAAKSRSLNGVNETPSANKLDLQNLSKSNSRAVEKHKYKQKEKGIPHEHYSDGGSSKNWKMKSKKETDQDYSRASKKIKIDSKHHADKNWKPDHGVVAGQVAPSSNSGASRNDRHKYNNNNSSNGVRTCDAKNNLEVSDRIPKDQVHVASDDGSLHMVKGDEKDIVARKRKVNKCRDSQNSVEEMSENDHSNKKKARLSKSGEIDTSASKGSGGTARKGRSLKDQELEPDLGCTLSQQELGSVQPFVAATSSSSKVSGSRKNKSSLQEVKGSPVESVSSSPLRPLNPNKSTSTRKKISGRDDLLEAGFLPRGTPRRCSDGEDDRRSEQCGTDTKDETFTAAPRGSAESSVLDFQDSNVGHLPDGKAKIQTIHSPEFTRSHFSNGGTDTFVRGTQYPCKPKTSDPCHDEERGAINQHHANVPRTKKSVKGSSSRSKDKSGSSTAGFDNGKIRIAGASKESPYEEKSRVGKNGLEEKLEVVSHKVERNVLSKKESAGKPTETIKRESQPKFGGLSGLDVKPEADSNQDSERSSKRFLSCKTEREESGRGKSNTLPPSGRVQNETGPRGTLLYPGSRKENGKNSFSVDASEGDYGRNAAKHIKKAENQSGSHTISTSQAATNALKEAKDLKHLADRLKNSGSNLESTGLYFQAALKFLHGASLLESGNSESAKHGEMGQSKQIYSSTAKLCEFCAHDYEKSKDMASAALAHKCVEVAYMRVIYCSNAGASRDRHDLQTTLQIVPPGESPSSSSASDVDNLNNPATMDKVAFAKGVSSPQVAGNHVIAAQSRNSFVRLLNFAQEVNLAMEASRKSRIAFAVANQRREEAPHREGIASVKRALDFNFQDVEGLLRLVRLAMESISR